MSPPAASTSTTSASSFSSTRRMTTRPTRTGPGARLARARVAPWSASSSPSSTRPLPGCIRSAASPPTPRGSVRATPPSGNSQDSTDQLRPVGSCHEYAGPFRVGRPAARLAAPHGAVDGGVQRRPGVAPARRLQPVRDRPRVVRRRGEPAAAHRRVRRLHGRRGTDHDHPVERHQADRLLPVVHRPGVLTRSLMRAAPPPPGGEGGDAAPPGYGTKVPRRNPNADMQERGGAPRPHPAVRVGSCPPGQFWLTQAIWPALLSAGQLPFWLFCSCVLSTLALMLQSAAATGTETFCRTATWLWFRMFSA